MLSIAGFQAIYLVIFLNIGILTHDLNKVPGPAQW